MRYKFKQGKGSFMSAIMSVVIILIAIICISGKGYISNQIKVQNATTETQHNLKLKGPYKVVRVIDGDTIVLDIDGENKRVRMIGVNTPESVHPDESKNSEEGKIASKYTKDNLLNREVYIEYGKDPEDDYGRVLAYIFLDKEGYILYQQTLLDEGYAEPMIIEPNTKYIKIN